MEKRLIKLAISGFSICMGILIIIGILYFFSEKEWYEEHIRGEWLGLIMGIITFTSGLIGALAFHKFLFLPDEKKK